MKLGILSVAAVLALTVSASAVHAQQPGYPIPQPLPVVPPPGYASPQVIVSPPPVIVSRPVVVVPAPVYPAYGVTIARPGISVGIGGVYPAYGYYGRPYYGPAYGHGYGYGHHHHR